MGSYPRDLDYKKLREVTDAVGATLLVDISNTSGLIAAGLLSSPFEHCDIVTSCTYKIMKGPRHGVIFCRAKMIDSVNFAVFPMMHGGPHNTDIAAMAV